VNGSFNTTIVSTTSPLHAGSKSAATMGATARTIAVMIAEAATSIE